MVIIFPPSIEQKECVSLYSLPHFSHFRIRTFSSLNNFSPQDLQYKSSKELLELHLEHSFRANLANLKFSFSFSFDESSSSFNDYKNCFFFTSISRESGIDKFIPHKSLIQKNSDAEDVLPHTLQTTPSGLIFSSAAFNFFKFSSSFFIVIKYLDT